MPSVRAANINLFIEIFIRVALFSAFCYMETMHPFVRVIQPSEMETWYKYPQRESFVPSGTLWAIVLAAPGVISLLAWAACNDCVDAIEILLAWSLAIGINGVVTDTVKLIAGRPRPDFFYRCFPDGVETPDLQCSGDKQQIMDGRKSFPSGHSSLSFCSLGMASAWLVGRLGVLSRARGSGARVIISLAPLLAAACIAMSRSCDYHHHWQDILVGSILGYSTAIFCYRQYYHPLSSDLSGVPYIATRSTRPDSPPKEPKSPKEEPLLKKEDNKWI